MNSIFYKYFALNGQLPLQGIGLLVTEPVAARADVIQLQMEPPVNQWSLRDLPAGQTDRLIAFIADEKQVVTHMAEDAYKQFIAALNRQLQTKGRADMSPLGVLVQTAGTAIVFEQDPGMYWLQPVAAQRVVRQDEAHAIRVGEEEKTNFEMTDLLSAPAPRRNRWWIWALVIAALALGLIIWHFSGNSSIGNSQQLTHQEK